MAASPVVELLVRRGEELLAQPRSESPLSDVPEVNALVADIENQPHAFVLGCLMQRQVPFEKAWRVPYEIRARSSSFEFGRLLQLTPQQVRDLFRRPPTLHRFNDTMAEVFYRGVHQIADEYGGDASRIWRGSPSCDTVWQRFQSFHGAGPKVASMAVNILVRDLKVPLTDRQSLDVALDVHTRRVLKRSGLVSAGAQDFEMLQAARQISPDYPGLLDLPLWEIGRETCHETRPDCRRCRLGKHCPSAGERRGG